MFIVTCICLKPIWICLQGMVHCWFLCTLIFFLPYLAEDGRILYGLCAPRCMGCFFLCIYVCVRVSSFDFDFERHTVLYIVWNAYLLIWNNPEWNIFSCAHSNHGKHLHSLISLPSSPTHKSEPSFFFSFLNKKRFLCHTTGHHHVHLKVSYI